MLELAKQIKVRSTVAEPVEKLDLMSLDAMPADRASGRAPTVSIEELQSASIPVVLLVEREPSVLSPSKRRLPAHSVTCAHAESGAAALTCSRRQGYLIVSDMRIRRIMGGAESSLTPQAALSGYDAHSCLTAFKIESVGPAITRRRFTDHRDRHGGPVLAL